MPALPAARQRAHGSAHHGTNNQTRGASRNARCCLLCRLRGLIASASRCASVRYSSAKAWAGRTGLALSSDPDLAGLARVRTPLGFAASLSRHPNCWASSMEFANRSQLLGGTPLEPSHLHDRRNAAFPTNGHGLDAVAHGRDVPHDAARQRQPPLRAPHQSSVGRSSRNRRFRLSSGFLPLLPPPGQTNGGTTASAPIRRHVAGTPRPPPSYD